ncbi:hypothetical protein EAG_10326 [Camponotus floridanus]|uniref:Uncharacterized protein n=1 Tax=Camponotus floridanus TaxID=104421 RepID=E2AM18_CAMFO|nr:hypothetical protein EAG_10326 [Camponotus floridanus]
MGRGYIIPALGPSAFAFENKMRKHGPLARSFFHVYHGQGRRWPRRGRNFLMEIHDSFGDLNRIPKAILRRSTTAQEVSKSTEVQYTTLQLREQQPAKSPAREAEYHRRIRRTIAPPALTESDEGERVSEG